MRRRVGGAAALLGGLVNPVAAVAVLLCFVAAVNGLSAGRAGEDRRRLEAVLRRSCTVCYAAEGSYPGSLEELEERYGLQIDRERFTVRYRAYGENLMPEITVLENER